MTSTRRSITATPTRAPAEPGHRTWTHDATQRLHALSVWTERVPGHGEDAEPLVALHHRTLSGLLAVFDGSGGAGAAPAWKAADGVVHTGAWVGSRVARLATDYWFHDATADYTSDYASDGAPQGPPTSESDTPEALQEYLHLLLEWAVPAVRSKIVGTMRRRLPTTLAAVRYRVLRDRIEVQPMWAGDSRAYVLLPGSGLHVLTRDHTEASDALELLRSDPPMTNSVSADQSFYIEAQRQEFQPPCVLLVATDGFFGYLNTPAEFELHLLKALMETGSCAEWADRLRRTVQGYTADDASLALVSIGSGTFDSLRATFQGRYRELADYYARSQPPDASQASARRSQDHMWQAYRQVYEWYMPPPARPVEEHE